MMKHLPLALTARRFRGRSMRGAAACLCLGLGLAAGCGDDDDTAASAAGAGGAAASNVSASGGGATVSGSGGANSAAGGAASSGGAGGASDDCGNGVVDAGESCDDGDTDDDDGCDASCELETGWLCLAGSPTQCDAVCGDGYVRGAETCDDGNTTDNDGCDADCAVEALFACDDAEPSVCGANCGDGTVLSDAGDTCFGCATTQCSAEVTACQVDPTCSTLFTCAGGCGDDAPCIDACGGPSPNGASQGLLDCIKAGCALDCGYTTEQCDFGDADPNDGCGATCRVEQGYCCDDVGCSPTISASATNLNLVAPDGAYDGDAVNFACVAIAAPTDSICVGTIDDLNVTVGVDSTYAGEIVLELVSPQGTRLTLLSLPGLDEVDYVSEPGPIVSNLGKVAPITFDDDDANAIDAENLGSGQAADVDLVTCADDSLCTYAANPGVGHGISLDDFDDQPIDGTWSLCVGDVSADDAVVVDSVLLEWTLK